LRFSYALGDAAIAKYTASIDFERDSVLVFSGVTMYCWAWCIWPN